ncbi:phosphoglucosamine mutase, partial [Klebsiella pneumoniae]|nr:phosphoglucosamine mutase [Klebsiella pneumoniae]
PLDSDGVKAAIAEAEGALNGQGRLLVRPSGTEKLIRVMAEGDDEALVRRVVSDVSAAVRAAG